MSATVIPVYCEHADCMDVVARVLFPSTTMIHKLALISDALLVGDDPVALHVEAALHGNYVGSQDFDLMAGLNIIDVKLKVPAGTQVWLQTFDPVAKLWLSIICEVDTHELDLV